MEGLRRDVIVVGVDSSDGARTALRWAIDEARLRNTSVRAVYAWRRPTPTGRQYIPPELLTRTRLDASAKQLLDAAVDRAVADADVPIERVAVEGAPAETLADAARDAELLVVGTRHRRALGSVVAGSVSAECALLADCPVVVVHPAP